MTYYIIENFSFSFFDAIRYDTDTVLPLQPLFTSDSKQPPTWEHPLSLGYSKDPNFSNKRFWANSAEPDQTALLGESDQRLHCLLFNLLYIKVLRDGRNLSLNYREFTVKLVGF